MIINGKNYSEKIKLLEKLISIAKGNGFETLKVCVQNLSEHEKFVCKRKGFIVIFHATTGTTHGTIASAAKSISNVSFFLCCVFYQNNFH